MAFPTTTISSEVRALTDAFVATPVGDVITYDQMSRALGADIDARRYLIQRALTIASRESGAIFGSLRGIGYERLAPDDAHTLGSTARARMRNTCRRWSRAIQGAIELANDVSEDGRRKAYAEISVLNLIHHISSDRSRKAVQQTDKPQPVAMTMRNLLTRIGGIKETDDGR